VDLAGSERLSETTGSNDNRLREMKNINKSLSELGNVILGLYQKVSFSFIQSNLYFEAM